MPYVFTTNNHVREIVDGWEVPADVRTDFDYIDWEAVDNGSDSASFVKYRGDWHDLGDVMLAPDSIRRHGYDGFNSDSHWSGVAYRYFDRDGNNLDGVVIARVYIED
jgi:hypothetical protein